MRSWYLVGICFLFCLSLSAQDTIPRKPGSFGLETGFTVSASGVNYYNSLLYQFNKLDILAGAKLSQNRLNSNATRPLGIVTGLRWKFICDKRITPFTGLDYQLEFLPVYSLESTEKNYNYLHELYLSYGVKYKLSKKFEIANSIGLGGYCEKYTDQVLKKVITYKDPYAQVKLFLKYEF